MVSVWMYRYFLCFHTQLTQFIVCLSFTADLSLDSAWQFDDVSEFARQPDSLNCSGLNSQGHHTVIISEGKNVYEWLNILCIQCVLLSCRSPPQLTFPDTPQEYSACEFVLWPRACEMSDNDLGGTQGGRQPARQEVQTSFVQGIDILGKRMWNIGWHLC